MIVDNSDQHLPDSDPGILGNSIEGSPSSSKIQVIKLPDMTALLQR